MQHHELAKHLACIEDHLMRWGWHSWDFDLTDTTQLYAPWSNPPLSETRPNERIVATYVLKNKVRLPVAFCVAELEADRLDDIREEETFQKELAKFHASLQELPMAMYTHRGWVWDYMNMAEGEDWHEDDPHLSVPLDPQFVEKMTRLQGAVSLAVPV